MSSWKNLVLISHCFQSFTSDNSFRQHQFDFEPLAVEVPQLHCYDLPSEVSPAMMCSSHVAHPGCWPVYQPQWIMAHQIHWVSVEAQEQLYFCEIHPQITCYYLYSIGKLYRWPPMHLEVSLSGTSHVAGWMVPWGFNLVDDSTGKLVSWQFQHWLAVVHVLWVCSQCYSRVHSSRYYQQLSMLEKVMDQANLLPYSHLNCSRSFNIDNLQIVL